MLEKGDILRPKKTFKRKDGKFFKNKSYVVDGMCYGSVQIVQRNDFNGKNIVYFSVNVDHISYIWKFFDTKNSRATKIIKNYGRKFNRNDITNLYR